MVSNSSDQTSPILSCSLRLIPCATGTRFSSSPSSGEAQEAESNKKIALINKNDVDYINVDHSRDFIHIDDIVDGLIKIMHTQQRPTDAWELGTGNSCSINQLFDMFKETFPHIIRYDLPEQKGNYRNTKRRKK